MADAPLQRTPLYDAHVKAAGKMVPFAGWEMPANYPAGLIANNVPGPRAVGWLHPPGDVQRPPAHNSTRRGRVGGRAAPLPRWGSTGGAGFGPLGAPGTATAVWEAGREKGNPFGVAPAGLGPRDS